MNNKKFLIIVVIIIVNLLFVWSVYRMFYSRKNSFDAKKEVVIDANGINKIESGDGNWKWNNQIYDFYKIYKINCATKIEINEFCQVMKASKSEYVDIAGIDYWIEIYFKKNGKEELAITLKHNYSNQVFFEYQNHTYNGKLLADYIKRKKVKK